MIAEFVKLCQNYCCCRWIAFFLGLEMIIKRKQEKVPAPDLAAQCM